MHQHKQEKTKYYTSPFAFDEKFGHAFEPAILCNMDVRNKDRVKVFDQAIQKWNVPQVPVDEDEIKQAAMEIGQYLADEIYVEGLKMKVLTKTESINGVSSIPDSHPIYRKSSPGYPFTHWTQVKTKDSFLTIDEKGQIGRAHV